MGHGRRIASLLVILVLATLNGFAAGSARPKKHNALPDQAGGMGSGPLGVIFADTSVRLNNQAVVPGTAVFKGDVIQTSRTAGAVVSFRNGATATLGEGGEVALEWENDPASLNLRQGTLVVQGSSRQPARIHVLGASVIVQGEGEFPSICRIAALGPGAAVFNARGHVEIHGAGAPFALPTGKSVRLEAGNPQTSGQKAGSVTRAIPEETVQHAQQTAQVPLKVQDPVNWEDVVRTKKSGRVQITLQDGSTLNVGARSELTVTKHDVSSGQTTIEMKVGRLRADVVKITKPAGKFEVKTQTAVIGVVGTSFIVYATLHNTLVTCLDGLVMVSNINPAIVGTITLHAGQVTNVQQGIPPGPATPAPTAQVNTQVSQTSVGGPSAVPGGAGFGGGAPRAAGNVLNAGTAAAGTATAATSGVTIAAAGSASNTLSSAASNLSQTAAASNSATSDSNSTNSSSTTTSTTAAGIQSALSPSTPCGCQ